MSKIFKIIVFTIFILYFPNQVYADSHDFNLWLEDFKKKAIQNGISKTTVNDVLNNAVFLENVIVYDNRQPEFFEKTNIYISKRSNSRALKNAKRKLKDHYKILDKVEKEFNVEKEIILALWSIETNFGNNFGKMDIISSLATLSFDKRRSAFFTKELLILLSLIDKKIVAKEMLFGSWAGAVGNFQFMPSTILNYGIDYDKDDKIELKKSLPDAIASAANYIQSIGWTYKSTCFERVDFTKTVDKKLFNHSARNIKNRHNSKFWSKNGLINYKTKKRIDTKNPTALVLPDGDVSSPKYLVTKNYEKILNWNRSLRFALTVCTLANTIKNEL